MAALLTSLSAQAATRYWSGNGTSAGGNGTWNTTSTTNWGAAVGGPFNLAWNNASNDGANFNTASATVTLGENITLSAIQVVTGGSGATINGGAGPYTLNLVDPAQLDTTASSRLLKINAQIVGTNGLTTAGTGTITLTNAGNTYSGQTKIPSGCTVIVNKLANADGTPSSLGAPTNATQGLIAMGSTTLTSTLVYIGAGDTTDRTISIGNGNGSTAVGSARIQADGSGPLIFSATNFNTAVAGSSTLGVNRTLTLQGTNTGNNTISGIIQDNTGAGGPIQLTKTNAGTWVLAGANTFSGAVSIDGGTLALGNVHALTNVSGITIAGGATLTPNLSNTVINAAITLGTAATTSTISAPLAAGSGTAAVPLTLNGAIGGAGNLTLNGINNNNAYSTIILNAPSDYEGSTLMTTVSSTTSGIDKNTEIFVKLGTNNALPKTTVLTMDGGIGTGTGFGRYAVLDLNGFAQQLAGVTNITRSLREQRIINTSATASTLTVSNSADWTFSGKIGFSGSAPTGGTKIALVKSGSGVLNLTGINAYAGNTTISQGTLALTGGALITNSASIVVATNAVLDVSGLSSAFTLAQALSTQTLSNSTPGAIINGTNNCSAGTVSLVYDGVNPSFTITNGGMTLSASTTFKVNKTGAALPHGVHKIISKATAGNVGLVAGTLPAVTVSGGGITNTPGETAALKLTSGELYLVVNAAPVAKAITNGAPAGVTSAIRLIGGKPGIAPTDTDGDPLLVSQVQNPSALLGASVTTDGTNIFYAPGLNASGADTVQYVVSDGYGGYGTNTMYVTVTGQSFNIVSGPTLTNNQFRVTFAGIPNFTYQVDAKTNLLDQWAFYTNLTAGANGLFQLVATNDPPAAQRYFRTRYQP